MQLFQIWGGGGWVGGGKRKNLDLIRVDLAWMTWISGSTGAAPLQLKTLNFVFVYLTKAKYCCLNSRWVGYVPVPKASIQCCKSRQPSKYTGRTQFITRLCFQMSECLNWYLVPGTKYTVPGTWYLVPGAWVPGTWYLVPGTWYQVPGTR